MKPKVTYLKEKLTTRVDKYSRTIYKRQNFTNCHETNNPVFLDFWFSDLRFVKFFNVICIFCCKIDKAEDNISF